MCMIDHAKTFKNEEKKVGYYTSWHFINHYNLDGVSMTKHRPRNKKIPVLV